MIKEKKIRWKNRVLNQVQLSFRSHYSFFSPKSSWNSFLPPKNLLNIPVFILTQILSNVKCIYIHPMFWEVYAFSCTFTGKGKIIGCLSLFTMSWASFICIGRSRLPSKLALILCLLWVNHAQRVKTWIKGSMIVTNCRAQNVDRFGEC